MQWSDIERTQPRLARLGQERLIDPGVVLVATIRHDGTPRLSPVEPYVLAGELWLSMMWQSTKARDLLRDPRILVHSVITNRDGNEGEFKIRGTARAENDQALQRRYADAVSASLGWNPQPGRFHLFAVNISQVTFITYDPSGGGDQHVAMWPPGREFVRRSTSATSVGDPESVSDIIQPGWPALRINAHDARKARASQATDALRNVTDYVTDSGGQTTETIEPPVTVTASGGATSTVSPTTLTGYDTYGDVAEACHSHCDGNRMGTLVSSRSVLAGPALSCPIPADQRR
jgi:hypothetical protein